MPKNAWVPRYFQRETQAPKTRHLSPVQRQCFKVPFLRAEKQHAAEFSAAYL